MSTRKTVREFVVDPYPEGRTNLVLRSDASWPTFLNNNAVWRNYSNTSVSYTIIRYYTPTESGVHTLQATAADNFKWSIDGGTFTGEQVLTGGNPQNTFSDTVTFVAGTKYKFIWEVTNTSGTAGFAATVTAPGSGNDFNLKDNLTVTAVPSGRYSAVIPYDAEMVLHIWGAGGGGGGNDAFVRGGVGSPGLYQTLALTVTQGDTLEVVVGQGGQGGPGDLPGALTKGGKAGFSRTNPSPNELSLNGGKGGKAGTSGASGAGGGGGGASAVLLNGDFVLIAGGGGGGGGAGIFRAADPNASISNNVIGATPSDYRGMNGLDKVGDGGGGGAGGGGYPGGTGGKTNSIFHQTLVRGSVQSSFSIRDLPADPGKTGGNLPANSASTGVGTLYYKSGFAGGGSSGSGNGQDGLVVLEIEPVGLASTKVGGQWKQVTEAFVKVGGAWKNVSEMQVKVDGKWSKIEAAGQTEGTLPSISGNYGTVVREYSS